jgi:hypothetical protein
MEHRTVAKARALIVKKLTCDLEPPVVVTCRMRFPLITLCGARFISYGRTMDGCELEPPVSIGNGFLVRTKGRNILTGETTAVNQAPFVTIVFSDNGIVARGNGLYDSTFTCGT